MAHLTIDTMEDDQIPVRGQTTETSEILRPLLTRLLEFQSEAQAEQYSHSHPDDNNKHNRPKVNGQQLSSLVSPDSATPEQLLGKISNALHISGGDDNEFIDSNTQRETLLTTVEAILRYSVNPTSPGFLDKLYARPLPPGIAAELVLAFLNTNVHVYQVSPVLTLIEKKVTKALAKLFGLTGKRSGGIGVQGGSASNLTSVVVARNVIFPRTKVEGNSAAALPTAGDGNEATISGGGSGAVRSNGNLLLFTSMHGHYSIEKAAQALGLGSRNVVSVPVNEQGAMIAAELERLIVEAKTRGDVPFYVNATAGTTVLGSFDPFDEIAEIAKRHRCWLHVDASWGGGFIFSGKETTKRKFRGIERADSIAINPHKMLGAPLTCSFLLTRDLKLFESAMTLRAGYLFHDVAEDDDSGGSGGPDDETNQSKGIGVAHPAQQQELNDIPEDDTLWTEPDDLADLTLQCGRRGDSLKFFLSWQYYGTSGYRTKVDDAYDLALYMSQLVSESPHLTHVLANGLQPQCLQICFYFTPDQKFGFGTMSTTGVLRVCSGVKTTAPDKLYSTSSQDRNAKILGKYNTLITARTTKALISRGFMIDFAPALEGQEDKGSFFRVVLNISTIRETVEKLMTELIQVGRHVVQEMGQKHQLIDGSQ